jgi:plastocyanin
MHMNTNRKVWALTAAAAAVAIACGGSGSSGSSSSSPTSPSTTPVATTTITISNNAVSPKDIVVTRGSQLVTFVNNDSQSHEMTSDPHPEHTDCPELNQVGFLNPGQSKSSGNFVTNRTVCGFHDHSRPDVAGLKGTITIR